MKRVLYKILFLIILVLPVTTFAETPKYELDIDIEFSNGYLWSRSNLKNFLKVIAETDEYIFIYSGNNTIYKYDKDFNQISKSSSGEGGVFITEDSEGTFFTGVTKNWSYDYANSQYYYEYYISKIDTDFKELSKIQIKFENYNYKSFSNFIIHDDKFYATYQAGKYPNYEYHIVAIDKDGNIINDEEISQPATVYNLNNEIYYIINKKENNIYSSEIYIINSSGESELIKKFENFYIRKLEYDSTKGYVIFSNMYDISGNFSNIFVGIYNKSFNEINHFIESYNGFEITDKYFIFSANSEYDIKIYIYDKNFNYLYNFKFDKTKYEYFGYPDSSVTGNISVINNDIYLLGYFYAYANTCYDYIVRYTIEDLYKVDQEIKAGEGIIDQSELSAFPGEEVTYSATPSEGYVLSSLKVITENGDPVEVTDNKFIMPNEKVIIQAEFIKEEPELPPEEENNEEELPKEDPPKETPKEENPNTSDKIIIIISIAITTSLIILLLYRYKKLNI